MSGEGAQKRGGKDRPEYASGGERTHPNERPVQASLLLRVCQRIGSLVGQRSKKAGFTGQSPDDGDAERGASRWGAPPVSQPHRPRSHQLTPIAPAAAGACLSGLAILRIRAEPPRLLEIQASGSPHGPLASLLPQPAFEDVWSRPLPAEDDPCGGPNVSGELKRYERFCPL